MTHEELLDEIRSNLIGCGDNCLSCEISNAPLIALIKIVELHRPDPKNQQYCEAEESWTSWNEYPCETIQTIEKGLSQWDS